MYVYVDENGLHEALLGSRHFSECVEFLVSGRQLDRLLLRTLEVGRVREAVQLVGMYNSKHGSPDTGTHMDHTPTDINSGLAALKVRLCI